VKRRSRDISVFSTSAIDLFASSMGAFIIIALILIVNTSQKSAKQEGSPPRPTPAPSPPPIPPEPAPTPLFSGFEVEVPLGIVVEWQDKGIDIDLHVNHKGKTVYFKNRVTRWGILTRDEQQAENAKNREIFFCPRFDRNESTGIYRVYLACYRGYDRPATYRVTGKIVVFPGTPAEISTPFHARVQSNHKGAPEVSPSSPSPTALEFEILLPPGSSGARDQDFQVIIR